jgi:hypothetical protein
MMKLIEFAPNTKESKQSMPRKRKQATFRAASVDNNITSYDGSI